MLIYYITNIPSDDNKITVSENLTNSNVLDNMKEYNENSSIIDDIINENEHMSNMNNPENIVNDYNIEDSQTNMTNSENESIKPESPDISDNIDTKITLKKNDDVSKLSSELHKFKANDLITSSGAPVSTAFNVLANNDSKDKVDFKRNNVDKYDANDYLPKEINSDWFQTDFTNAKTVDDDSLINIKPHTIGVNTVGQSLKNASHDIRGTIANPKYSISPWNNSTYESDWNIKSLC